MFGACFLVIPNLPSSEDEGSTLVRNVGEFLRDYTASHPSKQYSS
jgi:hypothetical protein